MKGIILAGGLGTRLYPMTVPISKQLIPIYDKPMIYYSLTTLMNLKIKDILLICTKESLPVYKKIFKKIYKLGISINFAIQNQPKGIAQALIIGKKFIKKSNVTLILGDNFFYGVNYNLINKLNLDIGAKIFTYEVNNPSKYGVIYFKKDKILKIVEKPEKPKSNFVATGLYIYDNEVIKLVNDIKPSKRGELEITDLNNIYIKKSKLEPVFLKTGCVWLDAGTAQDLLKASHFVQTIQDRQKILIGSPEETSYKNDWITLSDYKKLINEMPTSEYSNNLKLNL